MKKMLSLLMTLVLVASSFAFCGITASAESEIVYTVEKIDCAEGDVIAKGDTITLDITTNQHPGILMVELKLRYDKTLLKPVSGEAKGALAAFDQKNVNIAPVNPAIGASHATLGEIWITGITLTPQALANNEVIATITFEVLKDITDTSRVYAFGLPLASDADYNEITAECVDGGIVFPIPTTTTTTTTTTTEAITTTTTAADDLGTVTTTTKSDVTTTTNKDTTTTTKKATDDNPKTGEGDAWIIIAVIGVAAVAIVVLATVLAKKSKGRETDED